MAADRGEGLPAREEELKGSAPLLLGIDAGGSKVRCIAADLSGRALARAVVGVGANVHRAGVPGALRAALRAAQRALRRARASRRDVAAVGAGFAGGSDPSDLRALARGLARAFPRAKVGVATDAEIVLLGALGEFPGAVVVAGTGSIALGVSGRRRARSGGWGPLLGDEGSGFALGRSGLTAALRALDGRGRPTRLARSLLRALRARGAMDLLDVVKRGQLPTERIASLAPLVLGEAERGDAVAREIVEREAEELALAAAAVLRRLRLPRGPVAVAGGLFASERFRAAFRRKLRARLPHARMIHSTSPAEEGALALARARLRRAR